MKHKSVLYVTIILLIIALPVALAVQTYHFSSNSAENTSSPASPSQNNQAQRPDPYKQIPITERDQILGPQDAKVSVVEFIDFECPFCKQIYTYPKRIVQEFEGQVNWVYKNLPLPIHEPYATVEAIYAECIGNIAGIEAYIKFHDMLFEGQGRYDIPTLDEFVKKAAPSDKVEQILQCAEQKQTLPKIEEDKILANTLGIQGTPTLILMDHEDQKTVTIPGAVDYNILKEQIQRLLED